MNIKGVQSRQSHLREGSEDVSVLISQVLNPELPLNKSGNPRQASVLYIVYWQMEKKSSSEMLNTWINSEMLWSLSCLIIFALQMWLEVVPAGPQGSVFLRHLSWMAPLLPLPVGTIPVLACCRLCWVRWRQTWTLWVLTLKRLQHQDKQKTENKASLDSLWPWSRLWDV